MNVRKGKTFTEYQVNKMLERAENDFEKQWNDKLEEIRETTFEQVKVDMWSQFMSIAMATLEKFHNFDEEQVKSFYNNYIELLNIMKSKPLGRDFTPQDTIDHVKESFEIDLDSELSKQK